MATVTRFATNLALELGGQPAGPLRTLGLPAVEVDLSATVLGAGATRHRGGRVVLGEASATADLAEAGPLLDWLQQAVSGHLAPHDGALLMGDHNFKLVRRIGFKGARLTHLAWPVLDAREARQSLAPSLRWRVDTVDDAPAAGRMPAASARRKLPMTSNFRVQGLPFDAGAVGRVELPTLDVTWVVDHVGGFRPVLQLASRQLGPLSLTIAGRQTDAARAWAQKLIADGAVDDVEGLPLKVELLDAALRKVLVLMQLDGCLLIGMEEDPLGGADRAPSLTLRFDVAGMAFQLV